MININEIRNLYDEGVATKEATEAAEKDALVQKTIDNIEMFEDEIRKCARKGKTFCFFDDNGEYDLCFLRSYFQNAGFTAGIYTTEFDGSVSLEVSWGREEMLKSNPTLSRMLCKIFH